MKRVAKIGAVIAALTLSALLSASTGAQGQGKGVGLGLNEQKRIQKGFEIAPVRLDFRGKDRNLVGLGSLHSQCSGCLQ